MGNQNNRLTGTELIVAECYGNAKSDKSKEAGSQIVDKLRSNHRVERKKLMDMLNFNPKDDNEVKKFQRRIRPLMKATDGGRRCCVSSRQKNGNTYYFFDRGKYDQEENRIQQNVRNTIDSKPHEKIEELREEKNELRNKLMKLEGLLENNGIDYELDM